MRVKTFTTLRNSSQSKRASSVNGSTTKRVRLIEPSRHEPYGGSGCSPQGFVARMFSDHQLLFISLTRSISTKPGSAKSYVEDMITSHMRRAGSVLMILQHTRPESFVT